MQQPGLWTRMTALSTACLLVTSCGWNPFGPKATSPSPVAQNPAKTAAVAPAATSAARKARVYSLKDVVDNVVNLSGAQWGGSKSARFGTPPGENWQGTWTYFNGSASATYTFDAPSYPNTTFANSIFEAEYRGRATLYVNDVPVPGYPVGDPGQVVVDSTDVDGNPILRYIPPTPQSQLSDISTYLKPGRNVMRFEMEGATNPYTGFGYTGISIHQASFHALTDGTLLSISADPVFSPDGDGVGDTNTLVIDADEAIQSYWFLSVDGYPGFITARGPGHHEISWDGTVNGQSLPDGTYTLRLKTGGDNTHPTVIEKTVQVEIKRGVSLSITPALVTFSPDDTGAPDATDALTIKAPANTAWTLTADDGHGHGGVITTGTGSPATAFNWDGTAGGIALPDGVYTLTLATPSQSKTTQVTIKHLNGLSASLSAFSPNGDGVKDTVDLAVSAPAGKNWAITTPNPANPNKLFTIATGTGGATVTWDGKATNAQGNGIILKDGKYTLRLTPQGLAPSSSDPTADVLIDTRKPMFVRLGRESQS